MTADALRLSPLDAEHRALGARLVELHPEIQIKVLYQRDYLQLLVKYGLEPPSQLVDRLGTPEPLHLDVDPDTATPAVSPEAESA